MILSKAGRLSLLAGLLCLLLVVFAGASYGAVRFNVFPSPTEVINTGRAEVLGSFTMIADGPGVTGTASGGWAQIGVIFQNGMQVDNTTTNGIRLTFSSGFIGGNFSTVCTAGGSTTGCTAIPVIVAVQNLTITGRCVGFITIDVPPGLNVVANDFMRVEGVRGRVDLSDGATAGTDIFAQLQSINDPAANQFNPDTIRVAKSLPGLTVGVTSATVLLCFPNFGVAPTTGTTPTTTVPAYAITVTEGFARAFVCLTSTSGANLINDRVDTGNNNMPSNLSNIPPALLGAPQNPTQIRFVLNSIPPSISSVSWPAASTVFGATGSSLSLITSSITFTASGTTTNNGFAAATYSFTTPNQTGLSDINLENFTVVPALQISATNQTTTGTVLAGASLFPAAAAAGSCDPPQSTPLAAPRFSPIYLSGSASSTDPTSTLFQVYANIIRCNCYLLFTYVTALPGTPGVPGSAWDTGISIANTSSDTEVFGTNGAPKQTGPVTFYFYAAGTNGTGGGFVGSVASPFNVTAGNSYINLVSSLIAQLPSPLTSFQGYMIVKANFQYCHGLAYIADKTFSTIAQGYIAAVIPDPSIRGGSGNFRQPSAAADTVSNAGKGVPAGESLNN